MIRTRIVLALALGSSLAGCSTLDGLASKSRVDYARTAQADRALEVPPDLTEPTYDDRYVLPDGAKAAIYSSYATNRQATAEKVLAPNAAGKVRVERSGNDRWLVASTSPDLLWPRIKQFLLNEGYPIEQESAQTGVLTTIWTEKRTEAPRSFLQDMFHRGLGQKVATDEMNRYRVRLERVGDSGETEIYLTHQGRQEVARNSDGTNLIWTPTASDPGREAEMMVRLMTFLGSNEGQARQQLVATAAPLVENSKTGNAGPINLAEPFDRAWRRVGLALDRVGFTVEDRDRAKGLYFVRLSNEQIKGKDGVLGKLAFWRGDEATITTERLQVVVKQVDGRSIVLVHDASGTPVSNASSKRILQLLADELN